MIGLDNFIEQENRCIGTLYVNIFPVVEYPDEISIKRENYIPELPYTRSPWKLRDGRFVYHFGKGISENAGNNIDKLTIENPVFGKIIRRYLLASLAENVCKPWQIDYFSGKLIISKDVDEDYQHNDKFSLKYSLLIQTHHWQEKYFGLIVNMKTVIFEKQTGQRISYAKIKRDYGGSVSKQFWRDLHRLQGTHSPNGKVRGDALKKKFEITKNLFKNAFSINGDTLRLPTEDGLFKIKISPLEVVECEDY